MTVADWLRRRGGYARPVAVRRTVSIVQVADVSDFCLLPLPPRTVAHEHTWRVECRICKKWTRGRRTHAEAVEDAHRHLAAHDKGAAA